jgi:hypothetical protein
MAAAAAPAPPNPLLRNLGQIGDWMFTEAERIADEEDANPSADATEFAAFLIMSVDDEYLVNNPALGGQLVGPQGWQVEIRTLVGRVWNDGKMTTRQKIENIAGNLRRPQGGRRVRRRKLRGGDKTEAELYAWLAANAPQICEDAREPWWVDRTADGFADYLVNAVSVNLGDDPPPGWATKLTMRVKKVWKDEDIDPDFWDCVEFLNQVADLSGGHRPDEQFSSPVLKVLKAMSIHTIVVVGTAGDHKAMYSSDYDLMESVPLTPKATKQFQSLVKKAAGVGVVTDIKCGEVP